MRLRFQESGWKGSRIGTPNLRLQVSQFQTVQSMQEGVSDIE